VTLLLTARLLFLLILLLLVALFSWLAIADRK
jgi:hypothetical protein